MQLHLQRSIGGLALGVPPNSHGIRDFDPCGCVWLTGHKEDGCFLSTTINMIYSLLLEGIVELFYCKEREKRGRANNEHREVGNNRGKAPIGPALKN